MDSEQKTAMPPLIFLATQMWVRRWLIISITLGFGVVFAAAGFLFTPIYSAETVLIPTSNERGSSGLVGSTLGQIGNLASIAGISIGSGDTETEEALGVLRSRGFTEKFILDKNLLPELFSGQWDATAKSWKRAKSPPTLAKAYRYFDEKIRSISRDKKTGLITIQIRWKDRNVAAEWANELVSRLNAEMRARAISKADESVSFLEREFHSTSTVATQQAIGRLIEAQVRQRMLANVTEQYAFRVVDKALPPDPDNPVWPRKLLLIAIGLMLGGVISVLVVLGQGAVRDIEHVVNAGRAKV